MMPWLPHQFVVHRESPGSPNPQVHCLHCLLTSSKFSPMSGMSSLAKYHDEKFWDSRIGGNTNMDLFEHQLWETPQNTMVYPHFPKSLSKNGHLGVSIPFLGQTMFAWKCHGFKRE